MSKPLSDAEVSQMVKHWHRMKEAPPVPAPAPQPQLEVSRGSAEAAALNWLIENREYEPTAHRIVLHGWQCLNCGMTREDAYDGWCNACKRCDGDD